MTKESKGTVWTESDVRFMTLALSLADKAKGTTFPNPAVGAVVVRNGRIVGAGATSPCGGPHAERKALADAGANARGSTLYVTLEPCCHFGRTAPCTDAIIDAGISRVVTAVKDPNPLVNGKGNRLLARAGIEVCTGLLCASATRLNEDFFFWVIRRRPWVSVKLAMTLDGRIADSSGSSRWITSNDSRKFVHDLRRRHASVAVGRTTLERDNPRLTVRHGYSGNPVRIVFSSKASVPANSYFLKDTARTSRRILVVRDGPPREKRTGMHGIEMWHTGRGNAGERLREFLAMAYEENIPSLLVEGGGKLASSFVENGLANRIYLFYAPKILGGGVPGFSFAPPLPLSSCLYIDKTEIAAFGSDVMLTGVPVRS